jgi:hypothetical protein
MPIPEPTATPALSRRRLTGAVAALLALPLAAPALARAQDAEDEAAPAPIISTQPGDVPSFGGRRPGPINQLPPPPSVRTGVVPVAIQIEKAAVDAEIERLQIVDGVMQNPTGPWVVAWYEDLAALDEGGNTVMAGHIDYWNVGPAVFYSIGQLAQGDPITVTGEDGEVYSYTVEWVQNFEAAAAPIDEIVGPTPEESLTLITCGGTFDYVNGEYLERTVVRALRVEPAEQA